MKCNHIAGDVWKRMNRRKHVNIDDQQTSLERCLTLKRLVFIGVGKTVGVGIYVLIGEATTVAGPSVILSFLIAFLVTLLNGLVFAEYASKNPRTGAQYTYMYECVGEAVAFLVGWTGITGYSASLSIAARGWSGHVDSLSGFAIKNYTLAHIGNWTTHGPPVPQYPDIGAVVIVMVAMVVACLGVNFATCLNSFLMFFSGCLLVFISIVGLVHANTDNWFKQPGGFFPGGFRGILKASSACFYAFQGYDVLGFSSEETINPKKNIPRSIVVTLFIVTCFYLTVAISFTLMVPYTHVDTGAPFPSAFKYIGIQWGWYVVEIGPILALANLCVLEMYAAQRLTYSIASDGLLFSVLAKVNHTTKVPIGPVLLLGPVVIVLVLCIDLSNLIGFMVIYAFIQYSFFSSYLIILRYQVLSEYDLIDKKSIKKHFVGRIKDYYTKTISVKVFVIVLYISSFLMSLLITLRGDHVIQGSFGDILAIVLVVMVMLVAMVTIYSKEQHVDQQGFLVPCMPFLPVATIFVNHLMLMSVVDKGSLAASLTLATVGVLLYLLVVVCDVVKGPARLTGETVEMTDAGTHLLVDHGDDSMDEMQL